MPSNHLILCQPLLFPPSIFPASGSFPVDWLFTSGGQRIGASASATVLPMNIQDWFPLGLTGLISLQSKGLSRVFSSTTIRKHQSPIELFKQTHTRELQGEEVQNWTHGIWIWKLQRWFCCDQCWGGPQGQSSILGSIVTLASNRDLHPVSAQQLFTRLMSFTSLFLLPPGFYQLYAQFWEYGGEDVRRLRGRRRKFHFQKENEEFSDSLANLGSWRPFWIYLLTTITTITLTPLLWWFFIVFKRDPPVSKQGKNDYPHFKDGLKEFQRRQRSKRLFLDCF